MVRSEEARRRERERRAALMAKAMEAMVRAPPSGARIPTPPRNAPADAEARGESLGTTTGIIPVSSEPHPGDTRPNDMGDRGTAPMLGHTPLLPSAMPMVPGLPPPPSLPPSAEAVEPTPALPPQDHWPRSALPKATPAIHRPSSRRISVPVRPILAEPVSGTGIMAPGISPNRGSVPPLGPVTVELAEVGFPAPTAVSPMGLAPTVAPTSHAATQEPARGVAPAMAPERAWLIDGPHGFHDSNRPTPHLVREPQWAESSPHDRVSLSAPNPAPAAQEERHTRESANVRVAPRRESPFWHADPLWYDQADAPLLSVADRLMLHARRVVAGGADAALVTMGCVGLAWSAERFVALARGVEVPWGASFALSPDGAALWMAAWATVWTTYTTLSLWVSGATPGLNAAGLELVETRRASTLGECFGRAVGALLSGAFLGLGVLAGILHPRGLGPADWLSGSRLRPASRSPGADPTAKPPHAPQTTPLENL